jgi:hypothetical protein
LDNVALWPAAATAPFDPDAKNDYFDSLYHAAAVAGLNTSALIEAGIAGRPVHTVLLPEFAENQRGTLHFRYLLEAGGGLLTAAQSLDEHVAQLAESIRDPESAADRNRRFVEAFIRPRGVGVAATVAFADAIEACASRPAVPLIDPWWTRPLRTALGPVARRTRGSEHVERHRRQQVKRAARQAHVDQRTAVRRQRYQEELAAREARIAREHAETAARRAARVAAREQRLARKHHDQQRTKRQKARRRIVQRVRARLGSLLTVVRKPSS